MGSRTEQHTLLTDVNAKSAYGKAFSTLFANIRFLWESDAGERAHTLLITTPLDYGDVASVPANLAIMAAQSGACTILVDANLRAPGLQQRFSLEKRAGLSELLQQEVITPEKLSASLQATFVPRLHLLGAGEAASGGATPLFSPRLKEIIDGLCQPAVLSDEPENAPRVVLFHSLPVLDGADASLLGALVEHTVLTIALKRTTREQVKQAQEQLQRAHAHLAGTILIHL